jgi:hypothetical protein
MSRRPDHLGKRSEFSEKVKRQIAERSQGVCEAHRVPSSYGLPKTCDRAAAEKDHIKPEGLGGESTLDNGADLCKPCHKIKSVIDTAMMLKADKKGGRVGQYSRRQKAKANGTYRPIQSRGFSKTHRRKVSGKIERIER